MSKRARAGVGSGGWITMCREWVLLCVERVGALLRVGRRDRGVGSRGVSVRRWIEVGLVRRVVSVCGVGVVSFGDRRVVRSGIIEVSVSVDGWVEEDEEGRWKMVAMMVGVVVSIFPGEKGECFGAVSRCCTRSTL